MRIDESDTMSLNLRIQCGPNTRRYYGRLFLNRMASDRVCPSV